MAQAEPEESRAHLSMDNVRGMVAGQTAPQEPPARPAAPQPQAERGRWIEVLKNCGEHLSDMELKIIRKQLASS